jgi:YVTN family beta-propeller protein
MKRVMGAGVALVAMFWAAATLAAPSAPREIGPATAERPHAIPGGFDLPNGWRITPAGEKLADTGDLVMRLMPAPDGKALIVVNSGYLPHGLTVIDPATGKVVQKITLKSTWLGLAWSPDGGTLYVSGGNAAGPKTTPTAAPVYAFSYKAGRLSEQPTSQLDETIPLEKIWWSGLARHPTRPVLYAANQGVDEKPTNVVVFDTRTGKIITRISVEISPYQLVLTKDGSRLFVSNWSSKSVSVIDTGSNRVIASIPVGANPNDMVLAADGRLFVACSNDNTVHVIDTRKMAVIERLSTTMSPLAPEGSTPNALTIDAKRSLLFAANGDNNSLAVIDIHDRAHSAVVGFIPTAWYPSALTIAGGALYIGSAKGEAAYPDLKGPHSPLSISGRTEESIKTLQTGSVSRLSLADLPKRLPAWTKAVAANSPYNDALLQEARPAKVPSIIPSVVGAGSPIEHVIYIIKENRTYDQVLGDLAKGNGDPRLAIFGRKVTPNQHALAEQFVLFDNFYADGEVSVDGHSWSNAAYATDFTEKWWPPTYGDHSDSKPAPAIIPNAGYLWDLARRKGLTYRSYGEFGARVSTGEGMEAAKGIEGLVGHISRAYRAVDSRDTELAKIFIDEFNAYEANFDSPDPEQRLPNYIVMALPENHTRGTRAGAFTPVAMVASNDLAVGQIVDRVSHSKYWPTTAIIVVEDDAQDGPDHVDARRTVALAISPYIRRGTVDSTLYSTTSLVRTMELLLGLPPMSQYDAAATPLYAAFGTTPDLTPFRVLPAQVDLNAKNLATAWGAAASGRMDFSEDDHAPMHQLNEIIWKSVMGPDSPMPPPVHRYRALVDVGEARSGAN